MKKLISFIGIFCLLVVLVLNLVFITILQASEYAFVTYNSLLNIVCIVSFAAFFYIITKFLDKKYSNLESSRRKKTFIIMLVVYLVINVIWIVAVRPSIVGDQIYVCSLAQAFVSKNADEILSNDTYARIPLSQYIQSYHQQISLAFVFSLFFRIIHYDGIGLLRVLNVFGNIAIVIALYKIIQHFSKKYETNKARLLFFILTFIPLVMLTTFIYGDIPSLALSLFSVYFMMKFSESNKWKYALIASIFTMFAYMMRMNNLIFVIATVIYLILNIFRKDFNKSFKNIALNILVITLYVVISIVLASLVQNYYLDKYGLDRHAGYPTVSFIYMAMEESWRGNGWYNENIGEYALKSSESARVEYVDKIRDRLEYFSKNKRYTFDFYVKKLASMWSENTYSSVWCNLSANNGISVEDSSPVLLFYEKTLLVLICACSCIALIQNRKNLSIDVIFLITIFIGGFFFHILWEAKSRYIIPYIIVLIPVASLKLNDSKFASFIEKIFKNNSKVKGFMRKIFKIGVP